MQQLGASVDIFADAASRLGDEGKTPFYAAIDGKLAAIIAVADPLKPSSVTAIHTLKSMGIDVVMVTGDNRRTAHAIARQVGIDHVVAEVLPAGKVEAIHALRLGEAARPLPNPSPQGGGTSSAAPSGTRSATVFTKERGAGHLSSPPLWGRCRQAEGDFGRHGPRKLAFVGDGINDAPALAEADVGIAIGTGTDVAIESADVVLVGGELSGVVAAIAVSRATMRNIRQNLFWAFGYNVALIPLAAGVLYPAFGLTLSPMIGAAAMAMSSTFVLANALRLKTFKSEETS
jgi:Cu+-exporting ATPase